MSQIYDVCVIGLGIAGLTACLYLLRQNVSIIAIGREIGGQLMRIPLIENYPGTGPVKGSEIIDKILKELMKYGFRFVIDEVAKVSREGEIFKIETRQGRSYYARAVVCASGRSPIKLGVEGEDKYLGRGVSYCVICDAPLYRGKKVLYISGPEPHLEMSITALASICNKVYWIPTIRSESIGKILEKYKEKIELLENAKLIKIEGDLKVRKAVIEKDGEIIELEIDGVFIELGYRIDTSYISHLVKINERGEIVIDEKCRTSMEGIFAAGDVTSLPYKQAVIAAGQGATAALSALDYLSRKYGVHVRKVDWKI
ncbi:MAG: FAD-dependent oxidoreductase [Crenarchaeota archaeon]|nr:FAD-dependent oxidoreductase [Thermoproteota archaeon]